MPTDFIVNPLLDWVLACLCTTTAALPNPPTQCCHRIGDHTPIGVSDLTDECCQGLAWVRLTSLYPTDEGAFPGPTRQIQRCGLQQWGARIEIGIARCVPVGTAETLPTCAEWNTMADVGLADMLALRQTVCCVASDPLYADLVVDHVGTQGPGGGCVRTVLAMAVKVVGCDEC